MSIPLGRSRAGLLRTVWAALLALAVALAAVDYHPAGEAHSFGEAAHPGGSGVSTAAVHPGQPVHFEPSKVEKRPECPICLHRLLTAGGHLVAVAVCRVSSSSRALFSGLAFAVSESSRSSREARAPPVS
jgi:hypothetical protein